MVLRDFSNKVQTNKIQTNKNSLYVHVPFCKSKCHYCNFNSYVGLEELYSRYFKELKKEIELYSETCRDRIIQTIYFGGGTPTCVDYFYIIDILQTIFRCYSIDRAAEISIESNPKTIKPDFKYLVRAGINRVSLGLQSSNNAELKLLGRNYSITDFEKSYDLLRNLNIININIDIIYGLPYQTLDSWCETIKFVIKMFPEHISMYSLSIEDNTKFATLLKNNEILPQDEELDRDMYHTAVNVLSNCNYKLYEISNMCRYKKSCLHNVLCWKYHEYIGFGAGAHSFFNKKRWCNFNSVERYINELSKIEKISHVTINQEIEEFMFLGLRLAQGISVRKFQDKFNIDIHDIYGNILKNYTYMKFIESYKDSSNRLFYKLTPHGIDVSNRILSDFLLEKNSAL